MNVWEFIINKHRDGIDAILLYVLHSTGSSPGRQGFKMAVAADGDFNGTIGGGIMEHKFVEMARSNLLRNKKDPAVFRQVHDKDAGINQSGMICSGEQTIFLYRVVEKDIPAIRAIIDTDLKKKNGTLELTQHGINFYDQVLNIDFSFDQAENEFIYKEKTGCKNIIHIIGGGHCALALSRLLTALDFYIIVYDERPDLNTMAQNSFADEKIFVKTYNDLTQFINGGENVYVVIMTFGYRTDDVAVRALLDRKFKYMGILGSKKKIEKMFSKYLQENIPAERLARIHAPVGLAIKSETTAEIAVSIAAEIICIKNAGGSGEI